MVARHPRQPESHRDGTRHSLWPNLALVLAVLIMLGLAAMAAVQHGAASLSAPAAGPVSTQASAAPSATRSAQPGGGHWTPPNFLQEESK